MAIICGCNYLLTLLRTIEVRNLSIWALTILLRCFQFQANAASEHGVSGDETATSERSACRAILDLHLGTTYDMSVTID